MTETVLNNTTNAVFIPTIIAQTALMNFKAYLNLARTVARDSDYTTTTVGTTIQVPFLGTLEANDKTAGDEYTKQAPTATHVEVTLDQHKEVTVAIDDVTKVVENQDTLNKYGMEAARALAETIEDAVASLHPAVENTITWDRSSADTIDSSMLAIRKYFTDQKVPRNEQRYLYVDSTVFNDLLSVDKYTRVDARGDNPAIGNGQMIRTYGFDIYESQAVHVSGSPVCYHNLSYTRDAMVIATRPLPQPSRELGGGVSTVVSDPDVGMSLRANLWYDPKIAAHVFSMDVLYGVAILDQRRLLEVESV